MSLPREGSRVIREGVIVSVPMDWCKSPDCIVPYKIYTHHQVEGANTADSVRQTDAVSHVKSSLILRSFGDEGGVGGGCISGTTGAECEPKTWSETVRFEDRNAVRDGDLWWMNCKNCWGRLNYPKDLNKYAGPPEARAQYAMLGGLPKSAVSEGEDGALQLVRGPMPPPAPTTIPPPIVQPGAPPLTAPRGPSVGPSYGGPGVEPGGGLFTDPTTQRIPGVQGPVYFAPFGDQTHEIIPQYGGWYRVAPALDGRTMYRQQELEDLYRKKKRKPATEPGVGPAEPAPGGTGLRTTGRDDGCPRQIGTYGELEGKCLPVNGQAAQAHHYPPDYTMGLARTSRETNAARFENMPKFRDMPAICVGGQAGIAGTEHNSAQVATNKAVQNLGGAGGTKPGTARLGDVIDTSILTTAAQPGIGIKCLEKLRRQANKSFAGNNMDQLVRTNPAPPAYQAETMQYLMSKPPPTATR